MVTLQELVKAFFVKAERDFEDIRDVVLDDEEVPTLVKVYFNFETEPLLLMIKYPENA